MEQYFSVKNQYKDCILFYRIGDFYEMFYDDAVLVSKELSLTLTGKACGQEERAPMCGVPFHAADSYIGKLVEKGYKVAICEQTEDPSEAKGLVKREVIRIVTPGTITSSDLLAGDENNYLAALYYGNNGFGMAYADISTGELAVTQVVIGKTQHAYAARIARERAAGALRDHLLLIDAKEILCNDGYAASFDPEEWKSLSSAPVSAYPESWFDAAQGVHLLEGLFGKGAAGAFGLRKEEQALSALAALLSYLYETQKQSLDQLMPVRVFDLGQKMSLDRNTLRNLEILETIYDKKRQGSLLGILDRTATAMGARLMKKWLREPLIEVEEIHRRLNAVEELTADPLFLNDLRENLRSVYDFERLAAKIAAQAANARDLLALKKSLDILPELNSLLKDKKTPLLKELGDRIGDHAALSERIGRAVSEDAPLTIKEGGIIRDGYSEELDALKDSIRDAKTWIASLEAKERERTGIKNLKVGYNKVFGYYIDVTKSNLSLVPEEYIRRRTLVGSERYITPKLKEMESLVLGAEAKIHRKEYELFTDLRADISAVSSDLQKTGEAVAVIDVLASFASVSVKNDYVKPLVDESISLLIEGGRHPVIEQTEKGLFVSNDLSLDAEKNSLAVITGPNMAGKSTYMRQTALIVLMAQIGCFVPCDRAHIGVSDRIFTRIGASDNLSQGQSTFYVEMSELAYILHTATARSLVILDEIGRGTSTYDGLSIAIAAAEYLCNEKRHIRCLFATHYHEMTALAGKIPGIFNLNVDVSEEGGDIVFLHKIVPGAASKSYGIHVAKIAGVPQELLRHAQNNLNHLERESHLRTDGFLAESRKNDEEQHKQLSFFTTSGGKAVVDRLKNLDLMEVTPSAAIKMLEEFKSVL